MNAMSIVLHRKKHAAACLRKFKAFIDDQKVADIANGKEEQVEVSEGNHTLCVKLGLLFRSKPIEFNASAGSVKQFECGVAPRFVWFLVGAIIMWTVLCCFVFYVHFLSFEIRLGLVAIYCILTFAWNWYKYKKGNLYDLYLIEKQAG